MGRRRGREEEVVTRIENGRRGEEDRKRAVIGRKEREREEGHVIDMVWRNVEVWRPKGKFINFF